VRRVATKSSATAAHDIDEIPDPPAVEEPIPQVAADAGGKESQRDLNHPLAPRAEKENAQNDEQGNRRDAD
jgi:hypothetical protein